MNIIVRYLEFCYLQLIYQVSSYKELQSRLHLPQGCYQILLLQILLQVSLHTLDSTCLYLYRFLHFALLMYKFQAQVFQQLYLYHILFTYPTRSNTCYKDCKAYVVPSNPCTGTCNLNSSVPYYKKFGTQQCCCPTQNETNSLKCDCCMEQVLD